MKHKLNDIESKNIFKTPEGYLENLPSRIRKSVEHSVDSKKTLSKPALGWSVGFSLAAAITLLVVFNPFGKSHSESTLSFEEFSEEDLLYYLENQGISAAVIIENTTTMGDELEELVHMPSFEEEYYLDQDLIDHQELFNETDYEELNIFDI